ncbi:NAD(P)H-dependent oxidoreductase [Xenorhabdus bovienii]|uniref:NAD(P)H-dependent oxidoreductase n=1 Tax=Xenorhabdus bovienii TaxID=40576 RepID=UPI0023B24E05|nr:NAD(P)H-dependent oxidoreductase [Xenorhabdus bovienii]MDE9544597.1 NAD(P)H-dependent oxidoreductase [Xenorhabdus bovienii]
MKRKVIGLSGSYNKSSYTFNLVSKISSEVERMYGLKKTLYDMSDLGTSLGQAMCSEQLDDTIHEVIDDIINAKVLVIGVPTYKASYPGMFKHFFDLLEPEALSGKPIILSATGGSNRHALMLEYQLRPLFNFFKAITMPTAIYAVNSDYKNYLLCESNLLDRISLATKELSTWLIRQ